MTNRKGHGTGTSTPRSRGAYGSKRGTPDKQNQRTRSRMQKGRVQTALSEAEKKQRELEERIDRERDNPSMGETEGAVWARQQAAKAAAALQAPEIKPRTIEHWTCICSHDHKGPQTDKHFKRPTPWDGDPSPGYTVGDARKMLRDGYSITHVLKRTGIGYRWLDDIAITRDGRIAE